MFTLVGAAIVSFVFVCYWPLTRYFFAQDDFVFLERASHGLRESLAPFFQDRPGQFRPVTKGLYFLFTWKLFGFQASPYHVLSLALHALNSILVGVALRRMGISRTVSWVGALVFAGHLGHMEAVAWISCAQQLIGAGFVFAALIFGIESLSGDRRAQFLAGAAYALALASYEQTIAAPLVLLAWCWSQGGWRAVFGAARGPLRPMLLLFVVYCGYAGLRGMPDSGPYVMGLGKNVLDNLRTYTGFAFSLWLVYPAYGITTGFSGSHLVWIVLGVVHVLLRGIRPLVFGLIAFLAFLAPVLLLVDHQHSFHLYVPSIGAWFLLANAVDSTRRLVRGRVRLAANALVLVAGIIAAAGSAVAVRQNVGATLDDVVALPRSFVLRRAVLAERMCDDIRARWTPTSSGRLILLYPADPKVAPPANWRNVQTALGYGSAVRLLLKQPDLDVVFVPPAEMPPDPLRDEVLVFTELGSCYTPAEWRAILDRHQEGANPRGDDGEE